MDDALRVLELAGYLRSADHDGFSFAFPLPLLQERRTVLLAFVSAVSAPVTLLLLGFPGAWFVERMGWWLVNESVMSGRWLLYGFGISLGLFLTWLTVRPVGVRLRLDRHALEVKRSLRRTILVRTADIETMLIEGDQLLVVGHGGRVVRLPALAIGASELGALRQVVMRTLPTREEGDASEVPRDLSRVVRILDR